MTFSPLISGTVPHHNKFSSRAGRPITRLIQHHWAGVGGGIERMSDPNQQASCTYIITTDGRILGHVPEEYRPWTSGSAEADAPSVTIEVQNTGGQVNGNDSDPASWPISDAAHNAIIRLLVDVAHRHGWRAIDANTYVGHRQFYPTACPGGYLWSRMGQTRQLAQQAFTGGIALASTSTAQSITAKKESFLMALTDQQQADLHYVLCTDEGRQVHAQKFADVVFRTSLGMLDGGRPTFEELLAVSNDRLGHIKTATDRIPSLDADLRGEADVVEARDAAQAAADAAANDRLVALLAEKQGLTVEDIRAALAGAIADGIKVNVTVEGSGE